MSRAAPYLAARPGLTLLPRARRIKRTDASKLQDEYAKLVEGLQEANNAREREDDDVMANPGQLRGCRLARSPPLVLTLNSGGNSLVGRYDQGGRSGEYPESRALCGVLEAVRRVHEGAFRVSLRREHG